MFARRRSLYVFVISHMEKSMPVKIGMCVGAAYLGLQAPMLFLKNAISKRQLSIKRAFPDALDLLLICIESGMSIEAAFRKVATEIVDQSIALSEEFTLTTAELSYLQDRKVAYENLAKRTGLEGVKSVCLALQQSERYGTPLGQSLRVMAQENRDMRMNEAEKKAAALPPKLTVPMILFFLPVLFVVILGPTGIKIAELMHIDRGTARPEGSDRQRDRSAGRGQIDQSGWLSDGHRRSLRRHGPLARIVLAASASPSDRRHSRPPRPAAGRPSRCSRPRQSGPAGRPPGRDSAAPAHRPWRWHRPGAAFLPPSAGLSDSM